MRKWIEEYSELLLTGMAGVLLLMMILTSGVLNVIGERAGMPRNTYQGFKDFEVFEGVCQRKKPEIICRTQKQWYVGEVIAIEEAFAAIDANGMPAGMEILSITDRNGTDCMELYDKKMRQVIFQRAGSYLFQLKAQDEQKLCTIREIELAVDNRKVSR